jgi:hypothetical protein
MKKTERMEGLKGKKLLPSGCALKDGNVLSRAKASAERSVHIPSMPTKTACGRKKKKR